MMSRHECERKLAQSDLLAFHLQKFTNKGVCFVAYCAHDIGRDVCGVYLVRVERGMKWGMCSESWIVWFSTVVECQCCAFALCMRDSHVCV